MEGLYELGNFCYVFYLMYRRYGEDEVWELPWKPVKGSKELQRDVRNSDTIIAQPPKDREIITFWVLNNSLMVKLPIDLESLP